MAEQAWIPRTDAEAFDQEIARLRAQLLDMTRTKMKFAQDDVQAAVAAEREKTFAIIGRLGMEWHNALPDDRPTLMAGLNQIAAALRAAGEGGER